MNNHAKLKFIFGAIRKLAPLMKMEEAQLKYELGYHVAGRYDGSIKNLTNAEFLEVRRKIEQYARELNVNLSDNQQSNTVYNPYKVLQNIDKEAADRQRKKIIAMLREMGFWKYSTELGRNVADMNRIYAYIKEIGYADKELNSYTNQELPKLVSQIESIHLQYMKKRK